MDNESEKEEYLAKLRKSIMELGGLYRCCFCGSGPQEAGNLIVAPSYISICAKCLESCNKTISLSEERRLQNDAI